MKIKVEQRHIDAGEIANGNACPIALALIDAGVTGFYVKTYCLEQNKIDLIDLPQRAQDFITTFDRLRTARPFEFDIDIPEHPQNEIVCPVAERPHRLIVELLNKIKREPKPLIKV